MNLIVCIEKKDGMLFGGKRLSQDRIVREKMLSLAENSRLWVSPYTAKQFEGANVFVTERPEADVKEGEFFFLEDSPSPAECEKVVLYHWNRRYPADRFFDRNLLNGKKRGQKTEFAGSSHEKITEEIWE